MLVDSHCHLDQLDLASRDGGLAAVVSDAAARGVGQILSIAVDLDSSKSLVELTADFPNVYTSVGVHPLSKNNENTI